MHPIELDFDEELGNPQYIIQCPVESWSVFGFLDDTHIKTCRPGSGPVSNIDVPSRPGRQFADLIQ